MSADNGIVVHLMRGCHCIWGLPRRAVHSLCIADGTVSATCANFGAGAQGKWHSSSRRVESQFILWRAPQNPTPAVSSAFRGTLRRAQIPEKVSRTRLSFRRRWLVRPRRRAAHLRRARRPRRTA